MNKNNTDNTEKIENIEHSNPINIDIDNVNLENVVDFAKALENKDIKEENIKGIRIDGISATGLDEKGNLITNHQPQFYQLGKSTPELILKRIIQDNKFWNNKSNRYKNLLENITK